MLGSIDIKLDTHAVMPTRAHSTDAGLDLYAPNKVTIWPFGQVCIDTGVHIMIPDGYVGLLTSKSGLMRDKSITSTGTIDAGYTGSIQAVLFNHSQRVIEIQAGQKITQLVILPIETPALRVVDELPDTDRADNGFGSSGMYARQHRTYFDLCYDRDGDDNDSDDQNGERDRIVASNDAPVQHGCTDTCPIDYDAILSDLGIDDADAFDGEEPTC